MVRHGTDNEAPPNDFALTRLRGSTADSWSFPAWASPAGGGALASSDWPVK